jgi:hypothetical protein
MIGVQNLANIGTSGGPLISIDDTPGKFLGICTILVTFSY